MITKSRVALFLIILSFASCRKTDKYGTLTEPGIAMTFDDDYVDNWYKYLPLLDSLGVKATFYISGYHNLSQTQIAKLKAIMQHGNEIAYHTTNHQNIQKYLENHSEKDLLHSEIYPDLSLMKQDGFNPVVFAYPFGSHNKETDQALRPYFKSLRALNGSPNLSRSLTASMNERILFAMGMDNSSKRKEWMYDEMLHSASENRNCLVLVGHRIEEGDTNLKVSLSRLLHIVNRSKELGLKFYTVSEISAK
jgi:hypothetical protein